MKPLTYITQDILIQVPLGTQTVKAQVASNGLAYHPTWYPDGSVSPRLTVTHVASGYALCSKTEQFMTAEQCCCFIRLVDRFLDWRKEASEVCPHRELLVPLRAICRRIQKRPCAHKSGAEERTDNQEERQ